MKKTVKYSVLHDLKISPDYFFQISKGLKNFEVRFNDRDFHSGDVVVLREFSDGSYTGRYLTFRIGFVLYNFYGLKDGFVVFSLLPLS